MDIESLAPIRVGGFDITIADDTEHLGYIHLVAAFDGRKNQIGLSTAFCEEVQAQSLLHEAMHAIESVYLEGVDITEQQIALLGQGLYQVLRDNPQLVEIITSAGRKQDEEVMDHEAHEWGVMSVPYFSGLESAS